MGVEGLGCARVTEPGLNRLNRLAEPDEKRGVAVPQRVEGEPAARVCLAARRTMVPNAERRATVDAQRAPQEVDAVDREAEHLTWRMNTAAVIR